MAIAYRLPLDIYDIKAWIGKVNSKTQTKYIYFIFFSGLLGAILSTLSILQWGHPPDRGAGQRRVLCCAGSVNSFPCFSVRPRYWLQDPQLNCTKNQKESLGMEKNSYVNSFEMFGRMCVLLDSAPVYREQRILNLGYRFIPAVQHGKVRYYMRDGGLVGFCTWLYLTNEESETMDYDGSEAFSRDSGDKLWVMDMVALDSVVCIAKDLRHYLTTVTGHDVAYWTRPNGRVGHAWRLKNDTTLP
jgi:hemolysin-activating ACP:hemolysin acyltransferase